MGYLIKTKFPNQENFEDKKTTVIKHNEDFELETIDDVITLYNEYERQGYKINVKYESSDEKSPFDIAHDFDMAGIAYKATLKLDAKVKGDYQSIIDIAKIIEQHGFDLSMDIKLKIDETSPVNLDDETTWMGDGARYKVTPKVTSDNIEDLKGLYDDLQSIAPIINVKPKKQTSTEDFATQLRIYPDNTQIVFTLKEQEESTVTTY